MTKEWTQVPWQFCSNGYELIVLKEIQTLYVYEKHLHFIRI